MKDYKFVTFADDIILCSDSVDSIIYNKGQLYEIVEMRTTFNDAVTLIKTKNPSGWKFLEESSKLFTLNDIRRMKLETLKKKI